MTCHINIDIIPHTGPIVKGGKLIGFVGKQSGTSLIIMLIVRPAIVFQCKIVTRTGRLGNNTIEIEALLTPDGGGMACHPAALRTAAGQCDGSISGCTSVRSEMSQGNIYTDDLWDVWENRFQMMRDRSWAHKGQCANCKVWRYCEGSGLHLYDNHGELLTCHYNRLHG